jgi:hypothetical protein
LQAVEEDTAGTDGDDESEEEEKETEIKEVSTGTSHLKPLILVFLCLPRIQL